MLPGRLAKRTLVTGCLIMMMVSGGCEKSEPASPPRPVEKTESSGPATAPASSVDEPLVAPVGTALYQLDLEGMHCQGCADTITKKVQALPGVKQARVSFTRKTAWVLVEDGSPTNAAKIEQAVVGAGYKAKPTSAPASGPA